MLAVVDCYTCRRRRVRCDRALPHCEKCANRRGLDCLGYKKPLVWNKGVASRGKMMGKTFPLPKPPGQGALGCEAVVVRVKEEDSSGRSSSPESEIGGGSGGNKAGRVVFRERGGSNGGGWGKVVGKREEEGTGTGTMGGGDGGVGGRTDERDPGRVVVVGCRSSVREGWLRPFNPEFFGNLDDTSKYYLDYFDKRVCRDFILFERHGDNPYRNLLSLAAEHPSFLHAALAVSARHYSNNTGFQGTHSLVYKGCAINSLSQDLQKPDYNDNGTAIVREPVLAAMLLFLFFEALESGKDTWKIHLRGARRLIQLSGGMGGQRSNLSSSLGVLITHVAAIDIIGKSLAFSGGVDTDTLSWGSTNSNPEEIFKFLEQTEHYSFLGCPAELLQVISLVSQHKTPLPTTTSSLTMQTLLSRIASFNPQDWVNKRLPSLNQNAAGTSIPRLDACELYHHVCAYKCAVHIFALQVLTPSSSSVARKTDELVDEIIAHISSFQPGSVFFKGVVWPVFLTGAAATSEYQREFVRVTLRNIWELLPQFNIKSAGVLLEAMWRDGEGDWKERLARTGSDYLFL
ncbi:hypothetical protein HOY80DRAFT_924824 [Tuber brumale]|nr:hypothetical protein HOY80DRAFT_924824 [Tuber brumale]